MPLSPYGVHFRHCRQFETWMDACWSSIMAVLRLLIIRHAYFLSSESVQDGCKCTLCSVWKSNFHRSENMVCWKHVLTESNLEWMNSIRFIKVEIQCMYGQKSTKRGIFTGYKFLWCLRGLSVKIETAKIWTKMMSLCLTSIQTSTLMDGSLQSVCPLNGHRREVSAYYYTKCQKGHKRPSKVVEVKISSAEFFC